MRNFYKKLKNTTLSPWLLHSVVFLFFAAFMHFFYSNALAYVEMSGLFVFDWEFIKPMLYIPGYFLYIPSLFCAQFFYIPWLGSILAGLLFFLVYLFSFYSIKRFILNLNISFILSALLPCLLLAGFSAFWEFFCSIWAIILNLGISMLLFYCIDRLEKNLEKKFWAIVVSFCATLFSLLLLYYLSGGWFIIGFFFIVAFAVLKLAPKLRFSVLAACIFSLALPTVLCFVSSMNPLSVWFNMLWFTPFFQYFYRIDGFVASQFFSLIPSLIILFYLVVPYIGIAFKRFCKISLLGACIGFVLLVCACALVYKPLTELHGKMFVEVENKDWDSLLTSCNRYWEIRSDGDMNNSLFNDPSAATFTKWALIRSGKLTDSYFKYVMYPNMAPLFNSDRSDPLLISMFLEDMGLFYESFHLSTLPLYSFLYDSPLALISMVKSGMAQNNYYSVQRPLEKLKKSVKYGRWADSLQNICIAKSNERLYSDSITPLFSVPAAADLTIFYAFINDTNNPTFFDYTVLLSMLRKDIEGVVGSIEPYRALHPDDTYLPVHVEEALLAFVGYGGQGSNYNQNNINSLRPSGFLLREETINRCDYFMMKLSRLQAGSIKQEDFSKEFGNTYWYYFLFAEPSWLYR